MRVRELWGRDRGYLLSAGAACCDAEIGRDGRSRRGTISVSQDTVA